MIIIIVRGGGVVVGVGVGGDGEIFRLGKKAEIVHFKFLRFAADCGNAGPRSSYGPSEEKSRGNTTLSHPVSVARRPDGGPGDPYCPARLAIDPGTYFSGFLFALR